MKAKKTQIQIVQQKVVNWMPLCCVAVLGLTAVSIAICVMSVAKSIPPAHKVELGSMTVVIDGHEYWMFGSSGRFEHSSTCFKCREVGPKT